MKTRIIQTRYWDDAFVVESSKLTKYLYIYLLSNQCINISGIFQLHDRRIMMETGLTPVELQKAKQELENGKKVRFKDGWVYVLNAEKNNAYRNSPKNETAYLKEVSLVPVDIMGFFNSSINCVDSSIDSSIDSSHKSKIINHKSEIINKKEDLDFEKLSKDLKVSIRTIERYYQKIIDYEESTGKKYKNYAATIRNWVRRDIDEGKLKASADINEHVMTEAERAIIKNLEGGGYV